MRVLVGCEESGVVRDAFCARGHDAISVDLKASRGDSANPHHRGDIVEFLLNHGTWDLIILHPDCTAMALSGNRTYGDEKRKHWMRVESIRWTQRLVQLARERTRRLCVENPRSAVWPHLRTETLQWLQPWMFGHPERKETGLGLWRLPRLIPTNDVSEEMAKMSRLQQARVHTMGGGVVRKRERSVTYQGIAAAMAEQWG